MTTTQNATHALAFTRQAHEALAIARYHLARLEEVQGAPALEKALAKMGEELADLIAQAEATLPVQATSTKATP